MLFRLFSSLLVVSLVGCASGPRARVMTAVDSGQVGAALEEYERFRENEGADGVLLAEVAALLLRKAALGDDADQRGAAMTQLSLAGTAGLSTLEQLSQPEHPIEVRARALSILAKRGSGQAKDELRGFFDEENPEVVAFAVLSLDASSTDDAAQLREFLVHPSGEVRGAAAAQFRQGSEDLEVRASLIEMARVDPVPQVRATATRSLGAFGLPAFEPLRERLSDADVSVRLAAVGALVRADRARGYAALSPLLEMSPSRAGIEAARLLSSADVNGEDREGATHARAYLSRALEVGDAQVRAQAALAVASFPVNAGFVADVERIAEAETDRQVQLSLARALLVTDADNATARSVLLTLFETRDMQAVQAASILAKYGVDDAVEVLRSALEEEEAILRRVAARALARDAVQPDQARSAMSDEDAMVRIHAAGGILAAANVS